MKKKKNGIILNVSSYLAEHGNIGSSVYSMSKAGLIGYTKEKAIEAGKYNIKINAILPGFLATSVSSPVVRSRW